MLIHLLRACAVALVLSSSADAFAPQKVARTYTEVAPQGFKFKGLADFEAIPQNGDRGPVFRFSQGGNSLVGYALAAPPVVEAEEGEDDKGRSKAAAKRPSIDPLIKQYLGRSKAETSLDETVEVGGIEGQRRRWEGTRKNRSGKEKPFFLEVWSYPLEHADIHLVYYVDDEFDTKWKKAIKSSGSSLKLIELVERKEVAANERTYENQLEWAEQEAALTAGWQAIGTPSKRFVILTNATKIAFVKEVIKRLEVSRDVYEKDFPPPADFSAVSVVRICKDREEFQRFSGMGGGVAGYFSPTSAELVLYDNVETDRNTTYAVVSHEAFHQYCHYLFGQAEAHRWFDEGHGDYYGAMKITGRKGKITQKMPAGLDRVSIINELIRLDKTVPLREHLNYSHPEWQAHGVRSYSQSWSIIYMLRQGALRKVPRKVWKDEYADIIPNYVTTLNKGFRDLYSGILDERKARAKEAGRELTEKELLITRQMVDPRAKAKIWKDAMEASWGQIDLDEFEADWKLYNKKYR